MGTLDVGTSYLHLCNLHGRSTRRVPSYCKNYVYPYGLSYLALLQLRYMYILTTCSCTRSAATWMFQLILAEEYIEAQKLSRFKKQVSKLFLSSLHHVCSKQFSFIADFPSAPFRSEVQQRLVHCFLFCAQCFSSRGFVCLSVLLWPFLHLLLSRHHRAVHGLVSAFNLASW